METINLHHPAKSNSRAAFITGRVLSILCILFLLVDALMKVANAAPAVEGSENLGWPAHAVQGIGIVLLISTILYIIPRTAILGAILLTAYLGGATSIMVRVGEPYYFPIVLGVLIWSSLFLRHERIRNLIPLKRDY